MLTITMLETMQVGALTGNSTDLINSLKGELSRAHVKYPYSVCYKTGPPEAAWMTRSKGSKGEGRSRKGQEAAGGAATPSSATRSRGGGSKGGKGRS